ncbi:hypothetical protein TWF481_011344 [Arthrobotrys musiformis]|uniref:Uncharacterized protein n=1 Tax=Arthrobotrys musiformis TaxID=47236 RepID=A0AAV9W0H7_9PEZI
MNEDELALDLTAQPNQIKSSFSSSSSSCSPPLPPQPLSPIPIKAASASTPLESQVFLETPSSVGSIEGFLQKRARFFTMDSIPSSTETGVPSTTATSPPLPSRAEEASKLAGNTTYFSSSKQQGPIEAATISAATMEPHQASVASSANQRKSTYEGYDGLSGPKSKHLKYFLDTLEPSGPSLSVQPGPSRQLSPGRVPAAVYALEEAQKRNSQGSDKGSIRISQETRRLDVTSHPMTSDSIGVSEALVRPAGAPPTESERPETIASSVVPAVGSNAPEETPDNQEKDQASKGGIRFMFGKKRSKPGEPSRKIPGAGIVRQESSTTADTSTPLSIISDCHYVHPLPPPVTSNGQDARNFATFRRDLKREFQNRKLEGRHEHPTEGAAAIQNPTGIQKVGLTQLFRSISNVIKKGTSKFNRLVLRKAKTIPKKLSSTILGCPQPSPQEPESKKVLTRAQRLKEYRDITQGLVPSYGDRVPTPPPVVRSTPDPTENLVAKMSAGSSLSIGGSGNRAPYQPPPYRQVGLFASQPHEVAAKLSGKGKATDHLTSGDAARAYSSNSEDVSSSVQLSSSSSSQSAEAVLNGGLDGSDSRPVVYQIMAVRVPPALRRDVGGARGSHRW